MIVLVALAFAEEPLFTAQVNGDLKSFFMASFPYEHVLMPADPSGQGVFNARLKLKLHYNRLFTFDLQLTGTAQTRASGVSIGTSTGVGLTPPEAVDLSWSPLIEDLRVQGRVDRLVLAWNPDGVRIALGRQPITFGTSSLFTPLDLVNPFTPAVIDPSYKPGVDALRVDAFPGLASKVSLVAAYAGSWNSDGLILAVNAVTTIGSTDIGLFAGSVHSDAVFGGSAQGAIEAVGVNLDWTVTLPADGSDPFVRATAGALLQPTPTTTLTGEVYLQTLGGSSPQSYLKITADPHFKRNEIWLMGLVYAGGAINQEITPTVIATLATIANLSDPSAFLAPSIRWSVAENAEISIGGYVGLGERPDDLDPQQLLDLTTDPTQGSYLNSEFGTYPTLVFTRAAVYF